MTVFFSTAGAHIHCYQCQAKAKSTQQQCLRPAVSGKTVCKLHGGASTGPRTQEGRDKCAQAKIVHGRETRLARQKQSLASARLAVLESVGHALGFLNGKRTRGRKPGQMHKVYPVLQAAVHEILKKKKPR